MSKTNHILVVGAHTILGELLIQRLDRDPEIKEFFVMDLLPPKRRSTKIHFIEQDLIAPGSDEKIAAHLENYKIHTLVHCALKNNPSLNWVAAHDLEVIGTLNLTSAAKAAGIKKFILCSTTAVYGASPKNPNYLTEDKPMDPHPDAHFVRDKVEAEKGVQIFQKESPDILVTILRFCLILGPHTKNYFTELFRRPIVPTLLGYDPLMQFIHEQDAIDGLSRAVFEEYPGIFNIVGKGVIPLSYALRQANKWRLPLPHAIAYPLVQSLWNLQLGAAPGKLLDYFKYIWVADGEKASRVMDFTPKYSSKETFLEFSQERHPKENLWSQPEA